MTAPKAVTELVAKWNARAEQIKRVDDPTGQIQGAIDRCAEELEAALAAPPAEMEPCKHRSWSGGPEAELRCDQCGVAHRSVYAAYYPPTEPSCVHVWYTDNFGPARCQRCGVLSVDVGRSDVVDRATARALGGPHVVREAATPAEVYSPVAGGEPGVRGPYATPAVPEGSMVIKCKVAPPRELYVEVAGRRERWVPEAATPAVGEGVQGHG